MQSPLQVKLEEWPSGGEIMEFRLVVRGDLPPNKGSTTSTKHRIRREVHHQLRNLWQHHPALKNAFDPKLNYLTNGQQSRVDQLANEYARCNFRFVPLAKKNVHACALDILLLRRDEPARGFDAVGDLDNRIKTLLDGLRMPTQCSEVAGHSPAPDEDPFFVLMDDDSAIFGFRVEVDRLLIPADPNEAQRDIIAIIGVRLTTTGGLPISYISPAF